jgi:hypothetical protein
MEQSKISTFFNKKSKNVDNNKEKDTSETAHTSGTDTSTTDEEIMDMTSIISNENMIDETNVTIVYECSETQDVTKENQQIENMNTDSHSSAVTSIAASKKSKHQHAKPKRGDSSGHQERWLSLFEGLKYIPGEGYYCTICQQYSHSKQGIYISEPCQSYRIDKIRKHFGDPKGNMSNIHFNALKKERENEHGQQQTIERLNDASEVASRKAKSEEVMEKYFRTLYTCAKKNIPPNDSLDAMLCLQEQNGLDLDEIKITDGERRKSKRNTGEKVKSYRYCQPQEVSESLQCLAFPLKSDMVKCASASDGIVLVADETTDDSNCKQYNINVCCLKDDTPEWFFGEMIEVENGTASVLAHALKSFVETTLEQSITKVLAVGFDGCNTNLGEANGVKSWLKKWNPFIVCFWCLAHRLNLTVKDAADNVVEVAQFKELMHSIYQYFKNSSVRESTFKKLQEVFKGKSLKILENKDQRWLTSDAASKRIYDLYPELVVNLENSAEMKNDSIAAGLPEGLLSKKNVVCLMALRDVLPVVSTLCQMLQYPSGKDLTIEHFNDYYANCLDKLDEIKNGGEHINNLSNFLEVTCANLTLVEGET